MTFLAPRSVTWLRSGSAKRVRLKSRPAIFRRTIAQDSGRFIAEHEGAEYDIYFTVNPVKEELHKKPSKGASQKHGGFGLTWTPEKTSHLKNSWPKCWRWAQPTCQRASPNRT